MKKDFKKITKQVETESVNGSRISILTTSAFPEVPLNKRLAGSNDINMDKVMSLSKSMGRNSYKNTIISKQSLSQEKRSIGHNRNSSGLNRLSYREMRVKFRHILDYYFNNTSGNEFAKCMRSCDSRQFYQLLLIGYNGDSDDSK